MKFKSEKYPELSILIDNKYIKFKNHHYDTEDKNEIKTLKNIEDIEEVKSEKVDK